MEKYVELKKIIEEKVENVYIFFDEYSATTNKKYEF